MKKAGADSVATCFCSCAARNVNVCWAFPKHVGGLFFYIYTYIYTHCGPEPFETVLIQREVKRFRQGRAQQLVNPYALQPKTARGLETEVAWLVIFRV